jgi:hypothetical protein
MTFLAGICFLLPFVASERIEAIFGSSADGSFTVKVNGEIWFRSADTSLTANNKLHSAMNGSLKRLSSTTGQGSDVNGNYGVQSFVWGPTSGEDWTWELRVRNYTQALVFEQHFLSFLTGTAAGQEKGDEDKILSNFPSFDLRPSNSPTSPLLGYHQWAGEGVPGCESYGPPSTNHDQQHSCPHGLWPPPPPTNITKSNPPIRGGETAATAALAVMDNNPTGSNVVVISPASEFTTTRQVYDSHSNTLAFGIQGRVNSVPKGHVTSTIMHLVRVRVTKSSFARHNRLLCGRYKLTHTHTAFVIGLEGAGSERSHDGLGSALAAPCRQAS